jgi:hypothetical protein
MTAKGCGRITDHPAHFWTGHSELGGFDSDGYLARTEFRCPGRVVVEGGQRRHHTCTTKEDR